jgi:hypothetical protein
VCDEGAALCRVAGVDCGCDGGCRGRRGWGRRWGREGAGEEAMNGSESRHCGLCSLIGDVFRRLMCIGGSRRGSGESCYQELPDEEAAAHGNPDPNVSTQMKC